MEMLLRTCAENGNTQQNTIDAGMRIYPKNAGHPDSGEYPAMSIGNASNCYMLQDTTPDD